MSRYSNEQIQETRAGLERTAAEGGYPGLRWSDEEVCDHLDKWLPSQEIIKAAGERMRREMDRRIYAILTGKP